MKVDIYKSEKNGRKLVFAKSGLDLEGYSLDTTDQEYGKLKLVKCNVTLRTDKALIGLSITAASQAEEQLKTSDVALVAT